MSKNTPGPWHSSPTCLGAAFDIGAEDGSNIAFVSGPDCNGAEEFRANALLIAAAPDMLGALKAAEELADVMEHLTACRSDDEWVWAAQSKIKAAISKAEGTSNG